MLDATRPSPLAAAASRDTRPPEYHDTRAVWNGAIDRKPALIVRATGADDVVAAVRLARARAPDRGAQRRPRPGRPRHRRGGIVIDLGSMKALRTDPARRIAWAEPGLTWGEYAGRVRAHGLNQNIRP